VASKAGVVAGVASSQRQLKKSRKENISRLHNPTEIGTLSPIDKTEQPANFQYM
jgi:hypothetical protein